MDKDRIAQAHNPIGPKLMFRQFTGREELSRPFEWQLELLTQQDATIRPSDLLGKDITIELVTQENGRRFFNGHVTRFAFVGKEPAMGTDLWLYEARLRSWLWYLTREADCRIFQNKTVPDILDEVFGKYPFPVEKSLAGKYRSWDYCVQYQETDFNFVSRLMEHEGIYYYFKHEMGRHTLVLVDDLGAHQPLPGYATIPYISSDRVVATREDYIATWQIAQQVEPGKYLTDDYDYEKPSANLARPRNQPFGHPHGDHLVFEWPGGYHEIDDGENYAKVRLEALRAPHETVFGHGIARGIAPGYTFTLKNCPRRDQNREYLIVGAGYYVRDNPYHSGEGEPADWKFELSAQPTTVPFRPPRVTPKPLTNGPQTAVVVGKSGEEIWTDKYGRVKVQFHWDRYGKADENSSCWIRVSHPWAGSNWGGMFMPRIGQEVIVDFIGGDPDYPIITGRVYNAEHMPPYELPKYQEYSTLKSHSTKKGSTTDWNELRFVDYKGKEQVFIHANWRMDVRVKWNMYETIRESRHSCVGKEYALTVGGSNDHHVRGDLFQEVNGKKQCTVDGDLGIGVKGSMTEIVRGKVELNAPSVTIEALNSIVLKVGANFVEVNQAGITLQGSLTRINSGGGAAGTGDPDYDSILDCEPADTGEPGYLDRPRKGGGGGRKKTKWKSQHAPPFSVTKLTNGDLKLGNGLTIKKDSKDPTYQDKVLADLTTIAATKSGSSMLNSVDQSGKQMSIHSYTPAPGAQPNAFAGPAGGDFQNATPAGKPVSNGRGDPVKDSSGKQLNGTGKGTDVDVSYNPSDWPNPVNAPNTPGDVILDHEMTHGDHMQHGTYDGTKRTDNFHTNEEFNTIGPENEYRDERGVHRRTDHTDL